MKCFSRTRGRNPHFIDDQSGSLTIFTLFLFILVLMISGMAVDLVRHEHNRVAIQQTADSAVLASSRVDSGQTAAEAEALVREYFEKAGFASVLPADGVRIQGSDADNSRTVTIATSAFTDTMFMNLMGIDTLPASTLSQGSQSAIDVEVSLVLDISSSMNRNSRLPRLKAAVADFANEVVPEDPLASPSEVSINIVPYSLTVNPGAAIAAHFNIEGKHSYRDCIWFETSDYEELSITTRNPDANATQRIYERYTHMADGSSGYTNGIVNLPMCPDHEISPLLTTRQSVIDAVNALNGWDGTGIDIGAKWGLAMLDPAFRPVVDTLISSSVVETRMTGRPFDYRGSKKYLIIMSDGENDSQRDLHERMRSGPSPIWRDNTTGNYSVLAEDGRDANGFNEGNDRNSQWWHKTSGNFRSYPDTDGASGSATDWTVVADQMTNLSWPEVFNISKTNHLYSMFFQAIDNAGYLTAQEESEYRQPIDFNRITENDTNQRLRDICARAAAQDVTVFAISFDPPSSLAEATLRNCASAEGNFFSVNGDEISTAFAAIAGEITKLRLTQ